MENVALINKALKEKYGLSIDGNQKYRVVWSEGLTEKRIGKVDYYTPSGIFIKSEDGIHEVKKYSYVIDRYILEIYDPSFKKNIEIAHSDGYEPLFVFDKKGTYLKPYLWACEYLINATMNTRAGKRTESMDSREELSRQEKEQAEYFDFLTQEGTSPLGSRFTNQEAVILPGKEFK